MPISDDYKLGLHEAFGAHLRRLRIGTRPEDFISQEALAVKAHLDRTYIGQLEGAERTPSIFVLHLLADALGRPVSDLLPPHPLPRLPEPREPDDASSPPAAFE